MGSFGHSFAIHLDWLAYDSTRLMLSPFHQLYPVMCDRLNRVNMPVAVVNSLMTHSLHSVAMATAKRKVKYKRFRCDANGLREFQTKLPNVLIPIDGLVSHLSFVERAVVVLHCWRFVLMYSD